MEEKIFLNDDWKYSPDFQESMTLPKFKGKMESVRLPHTVAVTPFNYFDEKIYQKISLYRKEFTTDPQWKNKVVLLTLEGAAHESVVYLNGDALTQHCSGYTAFTVDLTKKLAPAGKSNVLAIKLNSKENLDIPPFGHCIDYMTYGGIYRDVYLEVKNPVYIQDVYVTTKLNVMNSQVTLNTVDGVEGYTIEQAVVPYSRDGSSKKQQTVAEVYSGVRGIRTLTQVQTVGIQLWDLDNPALYNLVTVLKNGDGKVVDEKVVRFGFRDVIFNEKGFFLNGRRIKLRGLNRHQSFPYVGYAMPKNMQKEDADILKYELGLNEVRTSHYPQSQYFVDRCDEIGLLVFTEIPGWQHIGGDEWRQQALRNVEEMVVQYRNHPSVFMWGVRINESIDCDELYVKTNELAHNLDPSRPTAGVRYLKQSSFHEDVYTYNDFSFIGTNDPLLHKDQVTDSRKGYMVTEFNGHMFPTKSFDSEQHRCEHALRHAKVLDTMEAYDEIGGASGWCAFDYNTHKDFGSGDRICYHGVMDMFRNPKFAAFVYQSQGRPEDVGDVLEVSSSMDKGEYPAGSIGTPYVLTNADSVKIYVNNIFVSEYRREDSEFKHLAHGPIHAVDIIGHRLVDEDGIPEKYNEDVKELLYALQIYSIEAIPASYKKKFMNLAMKKIVSVEKLTEFYGKYIGNWGGKSIAYKFEAYREGKLVKTVVKVPGTTSVVDAVTLRTELVEDTSYDVASVRLYARDEHGNLLPFCQEAVTLEAEGPVEIIGPKAVSFKGGMTGTYVKSTGKAGKAVLSITDWMGNVTKVPFSVKVSKK